MNLIGREYSEKTSISGDSADKAANKLQISDKFGATREKITMKLMLPFSIMKGKWIYGEIFAIAEGKTIYGEGFSIAVGKAIYGETGASAIERPHIRPDSTNRPQRDAFIRFKEICGTTGFT